MKTITKAELDTYSKYATPTERNEIEERHRTGLCDFACPICQSEIDDITAWVIREGIGVCPKCSSRRILVSDYDLGIDPQTGYHNAGTRYQCSDCGSEGEYEDV